MVYGPAPRTIIASLQNGDCSEKGSRFCAGWWRLLSESLLELLRDEAASAGIISGRMPNRLSAELLSNEGREKLNVAPIVFLSNQDGGCNLRHPLYHQKLPPLSPTGAAVKGQELPLAPQQNSSYSITSSAIAIRPDGMAKPRAWAVFKLMTNSNWVGVCTGRSAGLSPLRMRPV